MPQDRINLLEAKLSATNTAGSTSSASRASLLIGEPSRTTNSNPDLDKSMDKLKKLSTIIDLQVGPPNTPERNAFDGRLENLERLKVFITKKMRNVASNYGVTEGMYVHSFSKWVFKNNFCLLFSLHSKDFDCNNQGIGRWKIHTIQHEKTLVFIWKCFTKWIHRGQNINLWNAFSQGNYDEFHCKPCSRLFGRECCSFILNVFNDEFQSFKCDYEYDLIDVIRRYCHE